jgi:hypothetical protein
MNAAAIIAETETNYAAAVAAIADDVLRQIEDGDAPCRRCTTLAAGGYYFENVRVYFADVTGDIAAYIPRGVARVALDLSPTAGRRPAHEVAVYLEAPDDTTYDAEAIARAVLDRLDSTAAYAR